MRREGEVSRDVNHDLRVGSMLPQWEAKAMSELGKRHPSFDQQPVWGGGHLYPIGQHEGEGGASKGGGRRTRGAQSTSWKYIPHGNPL